MLWKSTFDVLEMQTRFPGEGLRYINTEEGGSFLALQVDEGNERRVLLSFGLQCLSRGKEVTYYLERLCVVGIMRSHYARPQVGTRLPLHNLRVPLKDRILQNSIGQDPSSVV